MNKMWKRIKNSLPSGIWLPFIIMLFVAVIVVVQLINLTWGGLYNFVHSKNGYNDNLQSIVLNMCAFVFEIVLLGLFLGIINGIHNRKKDITRWKEELSDFRNWGESADIEKEGVLRKVGHIRRLIAAGEKKINLVEQQLPKADLRGVNLGDAGLLRANLREANLRHANLGLADLRGTDLRGAQSLECSQLIKAKTLHKVRMDDALFNEVKLKKPELFATVWDGSKWFVDNELLEQIKKPDWKGWNEKKYDGKPLK